MSRYDFSLLFVCSSFLSTHAFHNYRFGCASVFFLFSETLQFVSISMNQCAFFLSILFTLLFAANISTIKTICLKTLEICCPRWWWSWSFPWFVHLLMDQRNTPNSIQTWTQSLNYVICLIDWLIGQEQWKRRHANKASRISCAMFRIPR